jgi:hypothetical protein
MVRQPGESDALLILHDTGVAPDHENAGVMKGSPPPLPSLCDGEGEKGRQRRRLTPVVDFRVDFYLCPDGDRAVDRMRAAGVIVDH